MTPGRGIATSERMFQRHPDNPIVRPGLYPWRQAVTFNPGVCVWRGKYLMLERAAGNLRPFQCVLGLLESDDGVRWRHLSDQPVLTPADLGCEHGSVQDPRLCVVDDTLYLTVAYRPYAWHSNPTGVGVPDSHQGAYPGFDGDGSKNQTRSGVLRSHDGRTWELLSWVNPPDLDDRDVILFPRKIGGRWCVLRRPSGLVTTHAKHAQAAGMALSWSDDLCTWSPLEELAWPEFAWESNRIGGSVQPIETERGWLVLYHGVETLRAETRMVCYRLGAMLLDIDEPTRILARCPEPIMEPETYYERTGLYIPNVIFPCAAVLIGDDELRLYYGCCDTAIALATASLKAILARVGASSRA